MSSNFRTLGFLFFLVLINVLITFLFLKTKTYMKPKSTLINSPNSNPVFLLRINYHLNLVLSFQKFAKLFHAYIFIFLLIWICGCVYLLVSVHDYMHDYRIGIVLQKWPHNLFLSSPNKIYWENIDVVTSVYSLFPFCGGVVCFLFFFRRDDCFKRIS